MNQQIITQPKPDRRDFLWRFGGGLGGIALSSMLFQGGQLIAGDQVHPARRFVPRAKRIVQLFMAGAASHLDLFDYKPELIKRHGQQSDFGEPVEAFQDGLGPWLKPVWPFQAYGSCGKLLGDVVAPLGQVVDEIAFIHNMVSKSGVHSQATLLQSTGFVLPGFPGMGCWASYGLGSENENLPTFVVLPDHRGLASNGVKNWDAAFLPGQHSGTVIYPDRPAPITDLFPPTPSLASGNNSFPSRTSERYSFPFPSWGGLGRGASSPSAQTVATANEREQATHRLLNTLNRQHAQTRSDDERLEARIRSYELAARMQLAAPEALDFGQEPEHILRLYGLDRGPQSWPSEINAPEEGFYFAQKCLAARRLLERGVRFVQIWSGNDNGFPRRNWDSHEDIERDHGPLARGMAQGAAALISDLKQRGMLDDTIVLWTTEFGRLPSSQVGRGRDHNPFVFTNWLCGGGIKGGISYGPSDEWGFKPLDREHPTQVYDVHATVLRLLGIDHTQLTWRHNGADRRLTDVHGHVIEDILA